MRKLTFIFARVETSLRYYLGGLYRYLTDKDIFIWAQAIAFKVLITMVPLVILATGVLGQVLQREQPFETVARVIRDFLPSYQSEELLNFLKQLQQASGTLTIIGIAGLLFSAMTLFTTLRAVISGIFKEEWHEHRSILGGYLFDLRMAGQVGLFFVLSVAISLSIQTLNASGIEQIGLDYLWLQAGWRRTFKLLGLLLPFLLSTAMFAQLFYFIPVPRPPKRSVLIGAVVTAVLWEGAKYSFTLYATRIGGFDRYGGGFSSDGIAALSDSFGLIIALVFWAYYSGIVLNLGALIALLHEARHRVEQIDTPSLPDNNQPLLNERADISGNGETDLPARASDTVTRDLPVN